ncbi:MAG: phosphate acetyltransferase [Planctomycetes bacterium]|nr:phosphate acetyltransferase [Planctomycetota bacterium]
MSEFFNRVVKRASENIRTIVLPEGTDERIIEAAGRILELGFANIVLLGNVKVIERKLKEHGTDPAKLQILDPSTDAKIDELSNALYELRKHKGLSQKQAANIIKDDVYFGTMLVKLGYADGLVAGARHSSADTIRPALQLIKPIQSLRTISSTFFMCLGEQIYLFSDCALVQNPTSSQLCDIAIETTKTAFLFGIDPRIAFLSYSTKGSGSGEGVDKVARAAERAKETMFALFGAKVPVDGELQFDAAFVPAVAELKCPGSPLKGNANVFIFPDLASGNICYKAVQRLAGAEAFGPVLQGLAKPVNDLSRGCDAHDIVATVAITAIQASIDTSIAIR